MLTKLKKFYSRSHLGQAYRFSRAMAGGIGGIFFTLGTIYKVPLKNFLAGYGPALTTLILSTISFIFKAKENYKVSDFSHPEKFTKEAEQQLSTSWIMDV